MANGTRYPTDGAADLIERVQDAQLRYGPTVRALLADCEREIVAASANEAFATERYRALAAQVDDCTALAAPGDDLGWVRRAISAVTAIRTQGASKDEVGALILACTAVLVVCERIMERDGRSDAEASD